MDVHIPKVEELMISNPVVTFLDSNIIHVAATLLKEKCSFLPILDRETGNFIGIISEKELMEELVNDSLDRFFNETPLEFLMNKNPHTLSPEMDMFNAEEIFRANNLRHAPVLKGKKIVGIISRKEILEAALGCIKSKKASFIEINKLKNFETATLTDYIKKINDRQNPVL